MRAVVKMLQMSVDTPLVIDSTEPRHRGRARATRGAESSTRQPENGVPQRRRAAVGA